MPRLPPISFYLKYLHFEPLQTFLDGPNNTNGFPPEPSRSDNFRLIKTPSRHH